MIPEWAPDWALEPALMGVPLGAMGLFDRRGRVVSNPVGVTVRPDDGRLDRLERSVGYLRRAVGALVFAVEMLERRTVREISPTEPASII